MAIAHIVVICVSVAIHSLVRRHHVTLKVFIAKRQLVVRCIKLMIVLCMMLAHVIDSILYNAIFNLLLHVFFIFIVLK